MVTTVHNGLRSLEHYLTYWLLRIVKLANSKGPKAMFVSEAFKTAKGIQVIDSVSRRLCWRQVK